MVNWLSVDRVILQSDFLENDSILVNLQILRLAKGFQKKDLRLCVYMFQTKILLDGLGLRWFLLGFRLQMSFFCFSVFD